MRTRARVFIGCYAMSGAAALVYQVVWTRLFSLDLGHTVAASSAVLAAFMGGLGAGAWAGSRLRVADRHRLYVYAGLETLIAIAALALPTVIRIARPLLVWAYADAAGGTSFGIVRVAVALAAMGLPAVLMGATFPLASAWLASLRATSGTATRPVVAVATLYAANTVGAAIGALAAGFWLIPAVGLRSTTWIAVGLNVAAAALAVWINRRALRVSHRVGRVSLSEEVGRVSRGEGGRPASYVGRVSPSADRRPATRQVRRVSHSEDRRPAIRRDATPVAYVPWPLLAYTAAAFSGCVGLINEVAWTRLLALVIGPTTYAFAAMAAAFVAGIGLGTAVCTRLARRAGAPELWLAALLLATGVCAATAASVVATRLPLIVAREVAANATPGTLFLRESIAVMLILLPIGACLGASFTMALAAAAPSIDHVQRESGRVYVANTVGAIVGALLAGFVLIDRLGLQRTIELTTRAGAVVAAVIGALLVMRRMPHVRAAAALVAIAVIVAIIPLPAWDHALLASGAYKYATLLGADGIEARLHAGTLQYYREGAAATVSVRDFAGTRSLSVDGKIDASNGADMLTQRLLGLLPVLMHPQPRRALVIGLGSGVTASSVLATSVVQQVDVVEISPQVVDASRYFAAENGNILASPRARLIVGDGRSHLALTTTPYDVIVSEPSNPWMAGVATLFTREFFTSARNRLAPGGILCQWTHTYEMTREDLASVIATFASVFPQSTMWLIGESDLLLVGTTAPAIEPQLATLANKARSAALAPTWDSLGIGGSAPFVLLSQLVGGPSAMARVAEGAAAQTDDRLSLEYSAPRAMYGIAGKDNDRWLRERAAGQPVPAAVAAVLDAATAQDWVARGRTAMKVEAFATAFESFRKAASLDPADADALRGVSDASGPLRDVVGVRTWLTGEASRQPHNAAVRVELARILAATGDMQAAMQTAADAARVAPDSALPLEQLASIHEDAGDSERLAEVAAQLRARFPERESGEYYRASALLLRRQTAVAIDAARAFLAAHPEHGRAHTLLGVACSQAGDVTCARAAFEASRRLMPRDPAAYINLGISYLGASDGERAAGYFAEALALDGKSEAARQGLARARALLP